MTLFYGTHLSKLDSKGRLVVPSSFRAKLRSLRPHDDGAAEITVVLRQSDDLPCVEVWAPTRFEELHEEVTRLTRFSASRGNLATNLFGSALEITSDREGRISLPPDMLRKAAIVGPAAFMGTGEIFQIWEPEAAEQRLATVRDVVTADRLLREGRERLIQNGAP
jgi:MraZ protein